MRETIRRIKKRKTWVNPTGWEMTKGKWLVLTISFYIFTGITGLQGRFQLSLILLIVAFGLTLIYIKIQTQLRNRFNDIEKKFKSKTGRESGI